MAETLVMGAVAYDPKVVTIWEGFRSWFAGQGFDFDFVLYSNYDRQVVDLVDGLIAAAWNSPLAWLRAERIADARGVRTEAAVMRDSDRDLTSVVVVRADSGITGIDQLVGCTVATGASDSPQATLIPLSYLRGCGLAPGNDFDVRNFDVGVGLHGDHIGGERDAARALMTGEVDAACMIDGNHLVFTNEGTLAPGSTTILAQTPRYDHCNMTVTSEGPRDSIDEFVHLLLGMSYADAELRPLLDLEGLKQWVEGRDSGYALLEKAVDETAFYDEIGNPRGAGGAGA